MSCRKVGFVLPSLTRTQFVRCLLILGLLLSHVDLLLGSIFLDAASIQYVRAILAPTIEGTPTPSRYESPGNLFVDAIRWSPNLQRAFVGLGRVYIHRQDYAAGEKMLKRALDLRAGDVVAHFQLGNTYKAIGRMDYAIEEWRKAGAAPYFTFMGHRYRDANPSDFDTAIDYYRLATTIDPSFVDAYYAEASVLWGMGRGQQAVLPIEHALAVDQVASARRNFYQGQLDLLMNQPNKAIVDFQQTLHLDSNYPQVRLFLGTALFESDRFQEAAEVFEQLVANDPSDIWPYVHLVRIFRALNQSERASFWYKRAMDIDPHIVKENLDP